jgi:hypothetical protein
MSRFDPTKAPWAGGLGFTEQLPDRTVSGNDRSVADKCCEVDPKNGFSLICVLPMRHSDR